MMAFSKVKSSDYDYRKTIDESNKKLNALGLDDTTYINNLVNYVVDLEYEGLSKKAPNGMLRINVARFSQFVKEAVAKTKALQNFG